METQTISSVNVTFNTLWFDLHDVGGINSVKFVAAETNDDDDLFYINGSSSAWENKTVGVSGGLKIASRRFDIEFRTQYFYQYNNETEEYEKVSIKVPMLFVQEEVFDDAISDIKSKNNITVTFGVATDDLEKLMADYDTTIEVFIEHKDVVTEASIIEFIGEAIEFN